MGFADDVKESVEATGEKIGREAREAGDRLHDKKDEVVAEHEVGKAEAERDSVKARNEYKEELRD